MKGGARFSAVSPPHSAQGIAHKRKRLPRRPPPIMPAERTSRERQTATGEEVQNGSDVKGWDESCWKGFVYLRPSILPVLGRGSDA